MEHFEQVVRSHFIVNREIIDFNVHDKIVTNFADFMKWGDGSITLYYQLIKNNSWHEFIDFLNQSGYACKESPWPPSPFPHLHGTQQPYSHSPGKAKTAPSGSKYIAYDPFDGTVADDL